MVGDARFSNSLDVDVNGETGTGDPADAERKDYSGALVLETHGSFHLQQNSQWVGLAIAPFGFAARPSTNTPVMNDDPTPGYCPAPGEFYFTETCAALPTTRAQRRPSLQR